MDSDNETVKRVFQVYNTQNFESIMQQLNNTVDILKILGASDVLCNKVTVLSEEIKAKLIDAISEMHPEQVFTVDETKSKHCAEFLSYYLNNGGQIFSTDYDLLLYWVLLRNGIGNFVRVHKSALLIKPR